MAEGCEYVHFEYINDWENYDENPEIIAATGSTNAIGIQNFGQLLQINESCVTNIGRSDLTQSCGQYSHIDIINDRTSRRTADNVTGNYSNENLQEPNFRVCPSLRKIRASAYYTGNYQILVEKQVEKKILGFLYRRTETMVKENQTRQELGFHKQIVNDGMSVSYDELLTSIIGINRSDDARNISVTAIVGSAGSGKTTLMRRMANDSVNTLTKTEQDIKLSSGRIQVKKLVHYIEVKDILSDKLLKPSKFLFGGIFESEKKEEEAYKWLLKNQSDVILYIDGLDQATWAIGKSGEKSLNDFEMGRPSAIMYNLLSKKLLPGLKIVVSSREFKISELPVESRPSEIIALSGLTLKDAETLFVFVVGDNGLIIWKKILELSPRLLNLLSVPVFLLLTAAVISRDPSNIPTTVTQLYNKIMLSLGNEKIIKKREKILEIIGKLKAMAFYGMKQGIVVFTKDQLDEFYISIDDAQDLLMKIPGNSSVSSYLLEGNFNFFFCHQSIQEFLAASFAAEMSSIEFSIFNRRHLHENRWSIVRKFICGIVFDNMPNDLHNVADQIKKQQDLARSIHSQLKQKTGYGGRYSRMELYTSIYESDNDDLIKRISVIDASKMSLGQDEAHIIGCLAARNKSLSTLNLINCNIDDEILAIISGCLGDQIQVQKVDLGGNNLTATALRSLFGHRWTDSPSGKLDWQVVYLTAKDYDLDLNIIEDGINICGEVRGNFNVKDSTLTFERTAFLSPVIFCGTLFEAKFFVFPEHHLYAKQDDLSELWKSKLEKISKILLDCTKEKERDIDWSLIGTSLKKYQLDFLDIAVNGQICNDDFNRITERCRTISVLGVQVNVHALFDVEKVENDLKRIVEDCQRIKIKYIRCRMREGSRASLDEISYLVKHSYAKKVTLIYGGKDDMLKGKQLSKAEKIANNLDSELEVLYRQRKVYDGWEILDIGPDYMKTLRELFRSMRSEDV